MNRYNGGTHSTYISSDILKYAGGTHFEEYFNNRGNPYSGETEYQGGLHLHNERIMKKSCLYLFLFLFVQTISAQVTVEDIDTTELFKWNPPTIEGKCQQQNIRFNIKPPYTLTRNKGYVPQQLPCATKGCVFRKHILYSYASLVNQDKNCEVYLKTSIWNVNGSSKTISLPTGGKMSVDIYGYIKSDLKWQVIGDTCLYAEPCEVDEIKMLLTDYPVTLAKKYFNADYMLMYPIDTKRQECRGKFTRCRCVLIGKDYRFIFMYFFLTDDNAKDLDKYLAQLKGMIWFN